MTETTPTQSLKLSPRVRASQRWQVLPIIEILSLLVALILPFVLQDYLTVFATRVLILCLFALSFDLVWGYSGIMSFGQALFFGLAGYGVALMARDPGAWQPIAGGTDVMVLYGAGHLAHRKFVSICNLSELRGIRESASELEIGAACTFRHGALRICSMRRR